MSEHVPTGDQPQPEPVAAVAGTPSQPDDAEVPLPDVPSGLGQALSPDLRIRLHKLLLGAAGQLGSVYRAMVDHPGAGPTELLQYTDCANAGVVGNRRVVVLAVMNGSEVKGPSVAGQAARTVRTLIKGNSDDVRAHLESVVKRLEQRAGDHEAVKAEVEQLATDSVALEKTLKQASGVYVYTLPHYWKHPAVPDTERRYYKIGHTASPAWGRVLKQTRKTSLPEEPLLLRVFETDDSAGVEKTFHMLLDAAEHPRSVGPSVGTEWFITTLEFCDAIAEALNLKVHKADPEA